MRPRHQLYRQYSQAVWTRDPGGRAAGRAGRDRRGLSRSRLGDRVVRRRPQGRPGGADVGAGRDVAVVLARRLDLEGRLQGRLRPAQAGWDHRRAAGTGGPLSGAVPGARAARRRAARRGASRGGRRDDDRRAGGAVRRGAARGAARVGRRCSCATARSASIPATSIWSRSGCRSPSRRRSSGTSPSAPLLHAELRRMADELADRMQRSGVSARTVTAKLRYADFSIRSRSTTLPRSDRRGRADRRPRLRAARSRAARPAGSAAPRRRRRVGAVGAPAADARASEDGEQRGAGGAQRRRIGRVRHVGPPSPSREMWSPA